MGPAAEKGRRVVTATITFCIHGISLINNCFDCSQSVREMSVEELSAKLVDEPRPMRYDIASDSRVPVTQKDWDEALEYIQATLRVKAALAEPDPESSQSWHFQLAVFPDPRQLEKAYVAEAKAIEAYPGLHYKGEVYFPPVPKTEWCIPQSFSLGFASELVRRWNRVPGQY